MKNTFAIIAFLSCLTGLSAQEFKIKKGNVLIDDSVVATVKKQNKIYFINNNEGNLVYKAELKNTTPKGRESYKNWLELTNSDGNVYQLEFKTKSLALNIEKKVIEHMIQNEFISVNGINNKKYNEINTDITDELDKIFDEYEKDYIIEDKLAEENNLKIEKYDNKIYKYPITANEVLIGYIQSNQVLNPKNGSTLIVYSISNSNDSLIAELKFGQDDTGKELKPLDIVILNENKTFPTITKSNIYSVNSDPMGFRMIKTLYANGYLK